MPFFSIIVPIYNVEKYLDECINSVLQQTFEDFELILVDDGSTDASSKICDFYSVKDMRVRVIHKLNGGSSSARNAGLRVSIGKYIMFLDSDDYWNDKTALARLLDLAKSEPDVIVFAATLLYPDGNTTKDSNDYSCVQSIEAYDVDGLKTLIKNQMIVGSACTKVIKRQFLLNRKLEFKEGIRCEDIEWVLRLSAELPSYIFYNDHFYTYRQRRDGSISNSIGTKHLKEYTQIVCDACNNSTWDKKVKEMLLGYIAYQYAILCAHTANSDDKAFRRRQLQYLKAYKWLFTYTLNPKVNKISKFYSIFGYYPTIQLLKMYLKLRGL